MSFIELLEPRTLMDGTILFVRGATRSGGFLNGGTAAQRDDQLADINNTSTTPGNHGWGALAAALRGAGYTVEQITEPKGNDTGDPVAGRPIRFETMDLTKYAAIVFGSNNARYPRASVDAIDAYVRNGGGAIFISDANFGAHWRDAPDSDQPFLARYGVIVNQDNGTYPLERSAGDFIAPDHPILRNIDIFDGEGVSPFVVPAVAPPDVAITRVVGARSQTRNNDGVDPAENFAGSLRPVTASDASLVTINVGRGRVAGFFDRNTFFNDGGVGSQLSKNDNRQFALNLFDWASDATPPAVVDDDFTPGAPSELRITFDDSLAGSLWRNDVLLRDPFTAEPVPRTRWSFGVVESNGQTVMTIKVKGAQPAGLYQMQINPGRIADDSGNRNPKRIRFNFQHDPSVAAQRVASMVAPAKAQSMVEPDSARARAADELFGDQLILA